MNQALLAAVIKLLRPLVQILLRNGIPFGAFSDLAKRVYVDTAMEGFAILGRKQSVSRVSIITGISRKEIGHVKTLPDPKDAGTTEQYNRAARVISGWVRDEEFRGDAGQPAELPLDGEGKTFSELVRRFSGDVPARAVMDELLRVGAVGRLEDGRIRLLTRAYLPTADEVGKLGILGTDVRDLIATIDHNLRSNALDSYFQRKVAYDNLPVEVIPELRALTQTQAQKLLEEMDRWMAQRDRDINPSIEGSGRRRAGIGIYYFEENYIEGGKKS